MERGEGDFVLLTVVCGEEDDFVCDVEIGVAGGEAGVLVDDGGWHWDGDDFE